TVIRCGILNRCKFTESTKRAKKQWTPCFAYLTGAHLIFYKDEKAAEKKGNQYEAPLGVCDLKGASIKWLESDKMKKRRIFVLRPYSDASYMFYSDDSSDVVSWYFSISDIISCLPKPDINYTNPLSSMENSPSISKTHSRKLSNISSVFSSIKDTDSLARRVALEKINSDGKKSTVNMTCSLTNSLIDSESVSAKQNRETILEKLRRFFFSRPSLDLLKEKGIYKPEPVFGSSLIDICFREKGAVPKFLRVCTALIEEKGLDNDGLYRMSGNLSQVQKIRCQVDQDKYALLQNETDVHVLTGALKLFFRELPNSLFPVEMTKDFLNAIKLQESKTRMKRFKELITKMPTAHRDCLDLLLKHLLRVAENAHKNRMQIHNLAIVFGPTLFSTDSNQKSNSVAVQQNGSHRKKKIPLRNFHSTNTTSVVSSSVSVIDKRQGGNKQQNSTPPVELIQSNSHLAFTMIMQGQIVEYMLKEYQKLLNIEFSKPK
uniref:Rho GTPase activating protein n=1 Tax=Romanomermis culicivorax TaxID=13658 RepID=A0A915HZ78_ROMCU